MHDIIGLDGLAAMHAGMHRLDAPAGSLNESREAANVLPILVGRVDLEFFCRRQVRKHKIFCLKKIRELRKTLGENAREVLIPSAASKLRPP